VKNNSYVAAVEVYTPVIQALGTASLTPPPQPTIAKLYCLACSGFVTYFSLNVFVTVFPFNVCGTSE
jgi:hypothetical protein